MDWETVFCCLGDCYTQGMGNRALKVGDWITSALISPAFSDGGKFEMQSS